MFDKYYLADPSATLEAGRALGRALSAFLAEPGRSFLVLLRGGLGAGKTTLCQGLAQGLGTPDTEEVVSPTFTLANEYRGPVDVFHLDLYRIQAEEFYEAGLDEYLKRPGLCLVEWPERLPEGSWPGRRWEISLAFAGAGREISVAAGPAAILKVDDAGIKIRSPRRGDGA